MNLLILFVPATGLALLLAAYGFWVAWTHDRAYDVIAAEKYRQIQDLKAQLADRDGQIKALQMQTVEPIKAPPKGRGRGKQKEVEEAS